MPISIDELLKVIKTIYDFDYHEFTKKRNACMLVLSLVLGLRPKECFDAKLSYLDIANKRFFIPAMSNKQRYQDWKTIPEFMLDIIDDYLPLRNKFHKASEFLFPTRSPKGRMETSGYDRVFRTLLQQSGLYHISYIDGNGYKRASLTPYSLRAAHGSIVGKRTGNMIDVAVSLRHKDPMMRTTLKYWLSALSQENEPKITKQVWDL